MKVSSYFIKPQFNRFAWVVAGLMAVFALINLLVIGGDSFVIGISDAIAIPLALITTLAAYGMLRRYLPGSGGRKFWGWFVPGWALWALAEILYVVMGIITDEVPYPSIADFAYIAGYFFFAIGLITRIQQLANPMPSSRRLIVTITAIVLMVIIFIAVLLPIVVGDSSASPFIVFLDLFYPIGDMILLLLLIGFGRRLSGMGWQLIIIGFILMCAADLVYTFSNIQGLYFPDDKVNLISSLGFSIPYNFAYFLWILGIYRLQIRNDSSDEEYKINQPQCVENTHIIIFVDGELKVDEVSSNSSALLPGGIPVKANLLQLLEFSDEEIQKIRSSLRHDGKVQELKFLPKKMVKEPVNGKICGISLMDPQKSFIGAIFLISLIAPVNDLDSKLTDYQKSQVKNIKLKCKVNDSEKIMGFLKVYYQELIAQIAPSFYQYGGDQQGAMFLESLNEHAQVKKIRLHFTKSQIEIDPSYQPALLFQDLTTILDFIRNQLTRIANSTIADETITRAKSIFSHEVNENLEYIRNLSKTSVDN